MSAHDRAAAIGICGPLGATVPDQWIGGVATPSQLACVEALRAQSRRLRTDVAETDRLATAVGWFEEFLADSGRVPFVDPHAPGGPQYNAATLEMFATYMRARGSRKAGQKGKRLQSDHISSVVAAVRLLRERTDPV